jgi:hypothetical protein
VVELDTPLIHTHQQLLIRVSELHSSQGPYLQGFLYCKREADHSHGIPAPPDPGETYEEIVPGWSKLTRARRRTLPLPEVTGLYGGWRFD